MKLVLVLAREHSQTQWIRQALPIRFSILRETEENLGPEGGPEFEEDA